MVYGHACRRWVWYACRDRSRSSSPRIVVRSGHALLIEAHNLETFETSRDLVEDAVESATRRLGKAGQDSRARRQRRASKPGDAVARRRASAKPSWRPFVPLPKNDSLSTRAGRSIFTEKPLRVDFSAWLDRFWKPPASGL